MKSPVTDLNAEKDTSELSNTLGIPDPSHLGASEFSIVQDGDGGAWTEDESEMEAEDSDLESGDDHSQPTQWDVPLHQVDIFEEM